MSRRKFARDVETLCELAADFGWTVVAAEHPKLDVAVEHPKSARRFGFRFFCDGWDSEPPSFTMFDLNSGSELPWDKWPQGWPAGQPHPRTGKPFLCLPGIREYHTHDSHLNDKWESYRTAGKHKLVDIVLRVKQRFGDSHG